MSQLPLRPSLSHLRKQAKARFADLKRERPDAQLSEAQHHVARDYGFASWPKLKAHVDLIAKLPQPVTFQRYTRQAKEALFVARVAARRSGAPISPTHLLLGIMRVSLQQSSWVSLLATLGKAQEATIQPPAATPGSNAPASGASEATLLAFRNAAREADAAGHDEIGLAHLLLGLATCGDSLMTSRLDAAEITTDRIRSRLESLRDLPVEDR